MVEGCLRLLEGHLATTDRAQQLPGSYADLCRPGEKLGAAQSVGVGVGVGPGAATDAADTPAGVVPATAGSSATADAAG